ncbi:SPP1 gp7 family putative phage head morphogenesis protein [Methanohalophilus levihalophilus]|uniref:minor capsid protein n=1 Tax=Methanohalophilus levihalophilus TaxID=1431282 RepID=UPI001AEABF31|nr:minor capsid protein [Methanohalophilus levihalophilus]MBP2030356.1 SPP1 gp7 family putative phage head morphogenesis protein [Methanohalophilus levihalophilus]
MSLLKSPELIRVEIQLISLLERTMERVFRLRTMDYKRELVHNVRREFGSKTYVKQLDNIITEIIKQSLLYADNQLKQISAAALEDSYVLTEEAVRISTNLADNVVESIVQMLKDEAIYTMHPNQLAKRIVDLWEGERYKAVRFARTFTADVATHTTVYRYRQRGVEYVEFDAELDDRTSVRCRILHGTIFSTASDSLEKYRPPLHHHCRSGLKLVPVTREIDPDAEFENRDFLHQMNQEGEFLKELTDEKVVEKAFENIDQFNDKYRISQFILDKDIEKRILIENGLYIII